MPLTDAERLHKAGKGRSQREIRLDAVCERIAHSSSKLARLRFGNEGAAVTVNSDRLQDVADHLEEAYRLAVLELRHVRAEDCRRRKGRP